jgi:hypothetical protein
MSPSRIGVASVELCRHWQRRCVRHETRDPGSARRERYGGGNSCRDDSVNDVAFPISLVCVCVHTYAERTSTYGTVAQCPLCGELEGTCRQVRESFSVQIGLLEPVCCTRPAVLTRKQCS